MQLRIVRIVKPLRIFKLLRIMKVSAYPPAMPCPVLVHRSVLRTAWYWRGRACYAMSGTSMAYTAIQCRVSAYAGPYHAFNSGTDVAYAAISRHTCYAMFGTDVAYAALPCCTMSGTDPAYAATRPRKSSTFWT
eukprot:3047120-Rhodomonas_salina.1